jgi:beta-glucanase (GH16 family)
MRSELLLLIVLSLVVIVSCSELSEPEKLPFLKLQIQELYFTPEADTKVISVISHRKEFTAKSSATWCIGQCSTTALTVMVEKNTDVGIERTAEITVVCDDITEKVSVIQQSVGASIQVDKKNILLTVINGHEDENQDFVLDITANIPVEFVLPEWIIEEAGNTTVVGQKKYSFHAGLLPEGVALREDNIIIRALNEKIDKTVVISVVQKLDDWELVWEDDFNAGIIDPDVWTKIYRGSSDWDRHMASYDELYDVKDGNLILRGIKNTAYPADNAPYLTGGVYTFWKKSFHRGKIEIRCKFESAQGAWPALWLLPYKEPRKWPDDGEIDIMEHVNFWDYVRQTVHTNYTNNLGHINNPVRTASADIKVDDYNVYAIELYADLLVWRVNGKQTFFYQRLFKPEDDKDGQFPFDQPQCLLMDMQLGGSWAGAVNDNHLPVAMYIDWVRYYQLR